MISVTTQMDDGNCDETKFTLLVDVCVVLETLAFKKPEISTVNKARRILGRHRYVN